MGRREVHADDWVLRPEILHVEDCGKQDGYDRVIIDTDRGEVETRCYACAASDCAVVMVGGVGGGFDSPAKDLYSRLSDALRAQGISCLRVRFRNPTDLGEAVHDVIAAISFLTGRGALRIVLIGHSFGGAVVIMAGAARPEVSAVITLSTQSFGTRAVADLSPRPLLLIHGMRDRVLTPYCSVQVYRSAEEPKELKLLENDGHILDESADIVFTTVRDWVCTKLGDVRIAV